MKKLPIIILLLLVSLFLTKTIEAATLEYNPYASVRFYTGYQQTSKEMNSELGESDTDLLFDLAGNTRFGAKFKLDEKLTGAVEIGLKSDPSAYLRLAYGEYDFGFAKLMVGQNYAPYYLAPSAVASADDSFQGLGQLHNDGSRRPMIKLTMSGAYITFIKYETLKDQNGSEVDSDYYDVLIPKLAAGFDFKNDVMMIGFGAGYMAYKYEDPLDTDTSATIKDGETISSYLVYAHGKFDLKPLSFQFNAGYGTNLKAYGIKVGTLNANYALDTSNTVQDTTSIVAHAQVGFDIQVATIYAGYGYGQSENDEWAEKDTQQAYFVNAKIPLGEGFFIQPEFLYKDYMKDETDAEEGNEWYAGAKFQMDFK